MTKKPKTKKPKQKKPVKGIGQASSTELEDLLRFQIRLFKLPKGNEEYLFHPSRKWRFDFAWPELMIAAECEGGIWSGGAHTRGAHFISDATKYNEATILGWRVLRFAVNMLNDGTAISQLERAFHSSPNWKGGK